MAKAEGSRWYLARSNASWANPLHHLARRNQNKRLRPFQILSVEGGAVRLHPGFYMVRAWSWGVAVRLSAVVGGLVRGRFGRDLYLLLVLPFLFAVIVMHSVFVISVIVGGGRGPSLPRGKFDLPEFPFPEVPSSPSALKGFARGRKFAIVHLVCPAGRPPRKQLAVFGNRHIADHLPSFSVGLGKS
uniref:Uncharacterized protein n=1 Tax=Oryza sativa subsp. japonica TaxID=39947 RepID=Q84SR9_ORYSJ|nr:hypothetical protein [Oryza sativa Japonica Group]